MPDRRLIQSMFHRRLLLLLALAGVGALPLCGKLAHLTIVRGTDLRLAANERLARTVQTPTVRGRILDRKGRVLAQDRPSYDVAVSYEVITGDWARGRAREAARRAAGTSWTSLSAAQKDEAAARAAPAYLRHLDDAWNLLAARAGLPRAELDARRDRIIEQVQARASRLAAARLEQSKADARSRGDAWTPAMERAARRAAAAPIAEMEQTHVLLPRVTDELGLECQVLAGEDVDIELPPPADRLGESRAVPIDRAERIPGLAVLDAGAREYPLESLTIEIDRSTFPGPASSRVPQRVPVSGLLAHVLGDTRDRVLGSNPADPSRGVRAFVGDAQRRAAFLAANPAARDEALAGLGLDRGAYRQRDVVGDSGLEAAQEHTLRGLRGVRTTQLDTGAQGLVPARPGRDLHLTIDAMLQARVQALLTPSTGLAVVQPWHHQESITQPVGTPLYGAAVVLDVQTAEVLALVSTPTFTREQRRQGDLAEDPIATPRVNRATQKYYTPGSIVKPIIYCEAVRRGVFAPDETIACTGHLLDTQPNAFRCWIYKKFATTHVARYGHPQDAPEAIMCSCNIFFYTLGRRLGPEGILAAYEDFGVGRAIDLGAGYAAPGALGFPRAPAPRRGVGLGDAMQMGIGQGPVTWTPLHAANAYATLARGGIEIAPRLLADQPPAAPRDLAIPREALDRAMEGLRRSIADPEGTGNHIRIDDRDEPVFAIPGLDAWGKTGTAAAPKVVVDPDGREGPIPPEVVEEGDHSWYVVLVGRGTPRYAIAVVIDYGGSGGKVSGPVAAQIARALIAEGYL